jgi:ADP-heptose:LPS heptosyltransferase
MHKKTDESLVGLFYFYPVAKAPLKILVVRFSSIGDIVLTTPVVRCLAEQLQAEVHFVTKEAFRNLLTANPHVKQIHTFKNSLGELKETLRAENFQWIIDLHHNLRSLQLKAMLRKPSRSFHKLNWEKWLLVQLKVNRMPNVHIVDRYMETVRHLGVTNDGKGLDFFVDDASRLSKIDLPVILQSGFVAITVGAKFGTKQLPAEKLAAIINYVGKPVALLGGKEDQERAVKIKSLINVPVEDYCGRLSLQQSASVIELSEVVIAHDTGLMHIAAALRKKIFSVWGNTVPELGMYPYLPDPASEIIEVKNLSCRPCSKIGFDTCPKGHFRCMNEINESAFDKLRN